MSYIKDILWQRAKAKYRGTEHDNDWVYIITYYNHIGGNILNMYCTPEEYKPCRVLCKLDNEDRVLVVDENENYRFYSVEDLLSSPKVFSYAHKPMSKEKNYAFKQGTVFGNKNFKYYTLGG